MAYGLPRTGEDHDTVDLDPGDSDGMGNSIRAERWGPVPTDPRELAILSRSIEQVMRDARRLDGESVLGGYNGDLPIPNRPGRL